MPRRTLSRRIQHAHRRLNLTLPIPVQRSGFGIPEKYTKTASGLRFFQYDSILIFASDKNLDLLVRHRQWLADRTFKCSPSVFNQLFTLHVYMAGSVVPVVYALLPNKTQTTYQRMLTEFCKLRLLDPETIMTDFERP